MKILYLTPAGHKIGGTNNGDEKIYNLAETSNAIIMGILKRFPSYSVTTVFDLHSANGYIELSDFMEFDIFICDLTTMNPNIAFHAGQIESLSKPIIYFISSDSPHPVSLSHKNIIRYSDVTLENEFIDELNRLIELADKEPKAFAEKNEQSIRRKAFVSYSHADRQYMERLMIHLKPLIKKGLIDVWVDTKIKSGDQWKKEIEAALACSGIAILLVSADFMASDFIVDNELPPLLTMAEVKGTKILPVIVSPCRFSREPTLNQFQAANSPSEPLSSLSIDKREEIYDKLANDIESVIENA